ncbi:MAG: hypothetical protein ILP10_07870 [Lachnospiraceae bacterium]|nr:hypothetical protein [Lachnospiraceae bacterium]
MNKKIKKRYSVILIAIAAIAVLCAVVQLTTVTSFNDEVHRIEGYSEEDDVSMDIHIRRESTASWRKDNLDLTGSIFDGKLHNSTGYEIREWTLKIDIVRDCYISQFWNGEVETHQFDESGQLRVQRFTLSKFESENIILDYFIDGPDLMIPLKKGDHLVYYPSSEFSEVPVKAGEDAITGMIFYYGDNFEVDSYSVEYKLHKDFTQGIWFIIFCAVVALEIILLVMYMVAKYIYRNAEKENELKKSGLSCMAEIYASIYIIDLVNNVLTAVAVDEEKDKARPKNLSASEQIRNLFVVDAVDDEFKKLTIEFGELKTLPERMKDRNILVFEYRSKDSGWCRVHFIAMDRVKDRPVEKVLFTIQMINEEKKELENIRRQAEMAKSESGAKSAFLENVSQEIRNPINSMLEFDTLILHDTDQDSVRKYARGIRTSGNMLLSMINGIIDYSQIEAGKFSFDEDVFSLGGLIHETNNIIEAEAGSKNLVFQLDVTPTIPDMLFGDGLRLKQIIVELMTNAVRHTSEGNIRLGIFGTKVENGKVHLLVSVRDSGKGMDMEDQKKYLEELSGGETGTLSAESSGIGMSLASRLLALMGSELKIASTSGRGSDFYFELELGVDDETPVGKIEWIKPE